MFVIRFAEETDVRFDTEFVRDTSSLFETDFVSCLDVTFQTQFIQNDLPPYYKGDYEVVPKREEQELATNNTILTDNVVVLEVPYSATTNLGGGTTYYIAKEND